MPWVILLVYSFERMSNIKYNVPEGVLFPLINPNLKMNRILCMLFMASALISSCSKDKENASGEDSLVGTWDVHELKIDENNADDATVFYKQIVDVLVQQGCNLITLTFNADGKLIIESATDDIGGINATSTGLSIDCPSDKNIEVGTWSLDGDQLTVTNADSGKQTVTIALDGDSMAIGTETFEIDGISDASVVFQKR